MNDIMSFLFVFFLFQGIKTLIEDFTKRGQPLIFHNLKPSVIEIFKGVKPSGLTCSSSELELNDCLKGKSIVNDMSVIHACASIF
jgi:hypothetical protein